MTSKNVPGALGALKYLGNQYQSLPANTPVERLDVFTDADELRVTFSWWIGDDAGGELAVSRSVVAVADEIPESEHDDLSVEYDNAQDGRTVEVTVKIPYSEHE